MYRSLKFLSCGAMLSLSVVLLMGAVPNPATAPLPPAGASVPTLQFNLDCGMCADDGDIEGVNFHHFDGDCTEEHVDGCQRCESHTEGCHEESLPDPDGNGCGDGVACAYARAAQELEAHVRTARANGDEAAVKRLMLETKVPFAVDLKASSARLYGCYGLLAAEVPISQRLAAELIAESDRRAETQR